MGHSKPQSSPLHNRNSLYKQGIILAAAANIWWGLSPLFWKQLGDFESFTLVAHRVTWSFLALALIQTRRYHWQPLREIASQPKNLAFASVTAAMLFMNWFVFIWAVNHDRVTEAALGYFLLPLVSVLLGRVVFRERLRPVQVACLAVVSVGVAWLAVDVGKVPWVTIVLGFSFAIYGAIRKRVEFGALDGLTLEVAILFVPMAGYLVWLQIGETPSVTLGQGGTNFLLVATALVTTFPLVTFARAVRLVPLSTAGLFQYINPSLQFLVGVLIYSESFEGGQVIGYLIIWSGLAIFAIEAAFSGNRESKRPAASVNLDHASSIDS